MFTHRAFTRWRYGSISILLFALSGCATIQAKAAPIVIESIRATGVIESALADIDERVQTKATTREEIDTWRKKRDEIRTALKALSVSLSTISALLLGGKPQ